MSRVIEYFFVANSPWSYLGHQRLRAIARAADAQIAVLPFDLGGRVFPISGGLPLSKRAPQRQAYRLVELKRFSTHLNTPMNIAPTYFPVPADDAGKLIIAVQQADGAERALDLSFAIMRALWVEERNIADEPTLAAILAEQQLPAARLEAAHSQTVHEQFEANTALAIERGVFGAPSYVVDGELFWGQDRLEFVERALNR
ncbi:MAG: 2-hydroxychromene-2-carboxylate isomerase [Burkholderiales bacterium]|nr:2-hydroxychromene-2-carboxylate isomerase [Burkholderiales bacterium]